MCVVCITCIICLGIFHVYGQNAECFSNFVVVFVFILLWTTLFSGLSLNVRKECCPQTNKQKSSKSCILQDSQDLRRVKKRTTYTTSDEVNSSWYPAYLFFSGLYCVCWRIHKIFDELKKRSYTTSDQVTTSWNPAYFCFSGKRVAGTERAAEGRGRRYPADCPQGPEGPARLSRRLRWTRPQAGHLLPRRQGASGVGLPAQHDLPQIWQIRRTSGNSWGIWHVICGWGGGGGGGGGEEEEEETKTEVLLGTFQESVPSVCIFQEQALIIIYVIKRTKDHCLIICDKLLK